MATPESKKNLVNKFKTLNPFAKFIIVTLGLVVIGGAAWAVSPYFYDVEVNESVTADLTSQETAQVNNDEIQVETLFAGNFKDADVVHKVAGLAQYIDRGSDRIVRFEEDFDATNGPDLYVWLVKDLDTITQDYVDLGRLKGNKGAQNYVIPTDVDLSEYDTIIIWCKAFSVLFGSAELS